MMMAVLIFLQPLPAEEPKNMVAAFENEPLVKVFLKFKNLPSEL